MKTKPKIALSIRYWLDVSRFTSNRPLEVFTPRTKSPNTPRAEHHYPTRLDDAKSITITRTFIACIISNIATKGDFG